MFSAPKYWGSLVRTYAKLFIIRPSSKLTRPQPCEPAKMTCKTVPPFYSLFGMQASTRSKERNSCSYVYNRVNKACPRQFVRHHKNNTCHLEKWRPRSNFKTIPGSSEKVFTKKVVILHTTTFQTRFDSFEMLSGGQNGFFFTILVWLSTHCTDNCTQIPKAEYWKVALFPGCPQKLVIGNTWEQN